MSIINPNHLAEFYHREIEPQIYKFWVGFPVIGFMVFVAEWTCFKWIEGENLLSYSPEILYAVPVAALTAPLLWYFVFYRQKSFEHDEVGILIALTKLDEKVDEELSKLHKKLEHLISTEKFEARVVVRFVPEHLIPKNEERAHALRDRLRARLIVWGHVDHGNHQSEAQTVFVPVYFSYRVGLPHNQAAIIQKGFAHVLADRKWIISEKNNILDREFLAKNLEEVSLYIIGAVLFFAKKQPEAFEVLCRVLDKYESKAQLSDDDNIAIVNIRILLEEVYKTEESKLNLGPRGKNKEKDIQSAEMLVTKMRRTGHSLFALGLEAQVEFAKGSIGRAIAKLKEAYDLAPQLPHNCFSLAFLYFYKGELNNGWIWLKRARGNVDKSNILEQIPSIVTWYEDTLHEKSGKDYLHFPLGVIYFEYLKEIKNSSESLNYFLKNYKGVDDKVLRPLIIESERILKKIKKRRR